MECMQCKMTDGPGCQDCLAARVQVLEGENKLLRARLEEGESLPWHEFVARRPYQAQQFLDWTDEKAPELFTFHLRLGQMPTATRRGASYIYHSDGVWKR